MQPIQMLLSPKQKIFSEFFFFAFPESIYTFEYSEREDEPQTLFVSEVIDC